MERLLSRLERRIGGFAVPNLIGYVVGGMAIVAVLTTLKPGYTAQLTLDLGAVRHGQVWRLVTFLFVPPSTSPLWLIVDLYFTWWVGSSLEQAWGAFKFNVYYLAAAAATILAAVAVGPVGNMWLDASLFLAFATVFPDATILLFFVIPVRVKWVGMVAAAAIVYFAAVSGWDTRAAVAAALASYVLFFWGHWAGAWKHRALVARQREHLERFRSGRPPSVRPGAPPVRDEPTATPFGRRECAICGASEADGADIRVCSCDKCGKKPRTLCLAHARAH